MIGGLITGEDECTEIAKTSGCIFKDIKNLTDVEVVQLVRKDNIDIAIDLMGYTKNHRINIRSMGISWCINEIKNVTMINVAVEDYCTIFKTPTPS